MLLRVSLDVIILFSGEKVPLLSVCLCVGWLLDTIRVQFQSELENNVTVVNAGVGKVTFVIILTAKFSQHLKKLESAPQRHSNYKNDQIEK